MKILLVEDMRAIAAVMKARLSAIGHDVTLAENGQVGFDQFCLLRPDLIFMDIEMPVMNGFEATNRIRAYEATQQWAWTPIIFLTASDTPDNLVTAIEAGGDDYLVKGISEEVLYAKMKAMARIAAMRQQLAQANQKLEQQANRDGLTGLFNRRWMDQQANTSWERCKHGEAPFALFMLDIDNFKKFNDMYGHQKGDDCLRTVARAIEAVIIRSNAEGLTEDAFVARYGGEEFSAVIPGASQAAYSGVAARIVEAVANLRIPHDRNDGKGIVTMSVGGHRVAPAIGNIAALFHKADAALYRAKERGRNCFELE